MLKRIFVLLFVFIIVLGCIPHNDIVITSTSIPPTTTFTPKPTATKLTTKTPIHTVNPEILEINSGKQQSQEILKAIEIYYEDNKVYPTQLTELVPNYLSEIPVTITGQSYGYRLFEQYTFILVFGLSKSTEDTFAYCAYLYSIKTWECGLEHLP